MRKKKNESVPAALFVTLLLVLTAAAGGIAWVAKNDGLDLSFQQKKETQQQSYAAPVKQEPQTEQAPQVQEDPMAQLTVPEEELRKIADTYGENFGILVSDGKSSVAEDVYCPDLLYKVEYSNGEVQINSRTKELYWVCRSDVKTDEARLTEREIIKKAKEYLAMLQIDQEYGHIVRRLNTQTNRATVIFQKVISEEEKLYSDFESVKMTISMQSGELITCKRFNLPLSEQEGQYVTEAQAISSVLEKEADAFQSKKAEPQMVVSSPLIWGEKENYTSRIVWKIEGDYAVYYVDAYHGDILGQTWLEQTHSIKP